MRVALLSVMLLAAAGCTSSSPRVSMYSESATTLRLDYANDAQRVADALQRRGCQAQPGFAFECPLQTAAGQSYAVTVATVRQGPAAPVRPREDGTEVARTEPDPAPEGFVTADGVRVEMQSRPEQHTLPAGSSPRPLGAGLRLQVAARVLDGATGEPVRLAGDAAAALRESLQALLVWDLPVVNAYYVD